MGVRKPDKTEEEETLTVSPFDPNSKVPETQLECSTTKNTIPYCLATGRHITITDLTLCPSCYFPASFSAFTKLIDKEKTCPMCQQDVPLAAIKKMEDAEAKQWLTKYMQQSQ